MEQNAIRAIYAFWIGLVILWFAAASRVKQDQKTEPVRSRMTSVVFTVPAFFLLFDPQMRVGILAARWLPDSAATAYFGLAITLAGMGLAIWARLYLGRNWSANVSIKRDHELIRGGPYAAVRHPIYSGFLLAVLGTAVAFGEVRGLIAFVLALAGWHIKSRVEEKFMAEQFGAKYENYKREVKALIPYVL